MWPLKTIFYSAFFFGACVAALINPIWGVVNYVVAYQTDPTQTWWGIPLAGLGIRFSLVAALFTMIGMLISRHRLPVVPSFSWWEMGVFALFLIAAVGTVTGVEYGPAARHEFEKLWKVLLFTIVFGRVVASRRNLQIVLWTFVGGCIYIGHEALNAPPRAFVMGRLEMIGATDFSTTSGAAAYLSAMLPLVGTVFLITPQWRWKIIAAVSGVLTVNTIVMCRTRSAFIGLLAGLLVAFLAAPRVRRYRLHAVIIAAGIGSFALTDDHFWTRMNTIADKQAWESDMATVTRREIWAASIKVLADYPHGIGAGNFPRVIGKYDPRHHKRSTHNSIVVCFVELGLQGGIVFLCLLGGALYMIYDAMRRADETDDPLRTKLIAYGILISLVTYLVTAMGTQRFYCESFWWIMVLPLVLHRIVVVETCQQSTAVELTPLPQLIIADPLPGPRYAS